MKNIPSKQKSMSIRDAGNTDTNTFHSFLCVCVCVCVCVLSVTFVCLLSRNRGTIPPLKKQEKYPKNAHLLNGLDFDIALYKSLKSMWNTKDANGSPKVPGRQYLGVQFQPFKPEDMSIVNYSGRYTRRNLTTFERKHFSQIGDTPTELYNSEWVPQNKLIEKYEKLILIET